MKGLRVFCAAFAVLLSTAGLVLAQPTPIIDPCGGPFELENKLGPTACIFPLGEVMIQGAYQSINVPGTPQGPGPFGKAFKVPAYAHVFSYPASVLYVGVTRRAEVDITPPSFAQINSGKFGTLAAGAMDMQFSYKQLCYINLKTRTLMAFKLTYRAPTGSQALRGVGPAYQLNPIIGHRFGPLFGLTLALPLNNAVVRSTPSAGVQRGWSLPPKLIAYWQSPGGTQLVVTVQHNFSPNVTPVSFGAMHSLNRHVLVYVQYGGLNYDGPIAALVHTTTNAYPRAIFLNAYYLIGRSDRPTLQKSPAPAFFPRVDSQ